MSETDFRNMIMQAEEEIKYLEEQCLKNADAECDVRLHALAVITLYSFALNLKLSGAQLIELLYLLDKESPFHRYLIAPYLLLLDDMELVCKQYGHAYLRFLSEKAQEKSDEEIYEALKAAQLENFVRSLADGLETRIGKNGIRLSGGQRQRLAIARLILSDPKIVIFDEATSALDNTTEFHLYETLAPFLKGRTTIIIAHRTTTIKQADYVYLIEEGRVKAEGSYEEIYGRGMINEAANAA